MKPSEILLKKFERIEEEYIRESNLLETYDRIMMCKFHALDEYLDEVIPEIEKKKEEILRTIKILEDAIRFYDRNFTNQYDTLDGQITNIFDKLEELGKRIERCNHLIGTVDSCCDDKLKKLENKVDQLSNPKTESKPECEKDPYRIEPIKPCEATKDGKHEWIGIPHTSIAECKHCGERQSWSVIYNKCLNRETGQFEPIFPEGIEQPIKVKVESKPECENQWEDVK